MVKLNENYKSLKQNYLFSNIAKRVAEFSNKNPDKKLIKMGIGDVTMPLGKEVVNALVKASEEMGDAKTFKGYPPAAGYDFLINSIHLYYKEYIGVTLDKEEIVVSDGAKNDVANITDLFANDNVILIPDPVYPVYLDSNLMLGRKITLIDGNEQNGFLPMPYDNLECDIIYMCSPNNPTGAVYTKEQLKIWVDFAIKKQAIIIFDAAYEAFIADEKLPRSIYQIEGAEKCAIEICSFSKTAGFTGVRLSYTVVPKALNINGLSLNEMWLRRQSTKYNGVSYIIQKAGEAVFSSQARHSVQETINYYRENARIMAETMQKLGIWFTGGTNSPYVWLKCGMDSWEFFDTLLNQANLVGTPGSGFGRCGEGYFRLTAFNTKENTVEAMERFKSLYK